jgi:AraC-like DNA-binding protein
VRLKSNDVPKFRRLDFWRSVFEKVGRLEPSPDRPIQDCVVDGYLYGPIGFVNVQGPGLSTSRQLEHVRKASDATLTIARYANPVHYNFGGDVSVGVKRGDILFCEANATYSMDFLVPGRQPFSIMSIQRAAVEKFLPCGLSYQSKPLLWPRSNKINALLWTGLSLFTSGIPDWGPPASMRNTDALCALIATILCPSPDMLVANQNKIDFIRLALAKKIIEMAIADPALDSVLVAQRGGMSMRTLERVFEPANGIMHYIQERRLELIHQELMSGKATRLGALAQAYGFVNASHFSTSFKRKFGLAPRQARILGGY